MEVYQATTTCAECKHSNKVIITREVVAAECENCGGNLLRLKRFDGVIYVLKNKDVSGVKIGMTTNDVFRRAKAISGTGVPGHFEVLAAFPSHNAPRDERKIHEKLKRKLLKKEHFKLEPVEAVTKVRSILGKDWVYLKKGIRAAVEAQIEQQRQKTASRFTPKKGEEPGPVQNELFGDENCPPPKGSPATDDVKGGKRGGFLANLFQG